MTQITSVSRQWASRPADERFLSLTDLRDYSLSVRNRSASRQISSRQISAAPVSGDSKGLVVIGPGGSPVVPTHFAFGQLAQRAGAPAAYLRGIPAPLAADCINYGLKHSRDVEDLKVLVTNPVRGSSEPVQLRAVTGPSYGRIYNSTVVQALVERFGDGRTGHFRVPGEFGKKVEITKQNTTIYGSDRDVFVFLADEDRRITIPGRRAGQFGDFARGFIVWNSEVGAATLGLSAFLFDYTCRNRIIWGATQIETVRIRHTAKAPDRWIEEVVPAVEAYAAQSGSGIVAQIEAARAARIDDVDAFLAKRFSRSQVVAIKEAHIVDEARPIETLWDAATGVTAYARGIRYQNERVALEREGGKIIELAA